MAEPARLFPEYVKSQAESVDDSLSRTSRKMDKAIQLMPPAKLRELLERNAQRQDFSQQQMIATPPQMSDVPQIQAAQLEDLLIQPQEFPTTISR